MHAFKNGWKGDFPGSAMIMISPSSAGGAGSIPGQGAKIPQASRPRNQTQNRSNIVTSSIKTLKMVKKKERENGWK